MNEGIGHLDLKPSMYFQHLQKMFYNICIPNNCIY